MRADTCRLLESRVAEATDSAELPAVMRTHVERCLRCQALMARHRKAQRVLAHLDELSVEPPDGSLEATLDALHRDTDRRSRSTTELAALAAAAAGVVALGRRLAAG